jgi:hypothetical protein
MTDIQKLLNINLSDLTTSELSSLSDHCVKLSAEKKQEAYNEFYLDVFENNKYTAEQLKEDLTVRKDFLNKFNMYFTDYSFPAGYKGNLRVINSFAATVTLLDYKIKGTHHYLDMVVINLPNTSIYLSSACEYFSYEEGPMCTWWDLVEIEEITTPTYSVRKI